MRRDAPILQTETCKQLIAGRGDFGQRDSPDEPTNVAAHIQFGDIDVGFCQADHVVEKEYPTSRVYQGYVEPQDATTM